MSNELIRIIEYLSVYNVTVYVIDYVVKHDYTALDNIVSCMVFMTVCIT